MAVKTRFSEDALVELLGPYDLGEFQASSPIAQGTVQTNLLVQTTRGQVVLKYYENRPPESVRFEANLIEYIRQRHYPCAAPYKNRQGRCVSLYHDKPYVFFEYVEGQHLARPNAQQRRQIIQAAAQLQRITSAYRPRLKRFRWNYNPALCLKLAQAEARKIGTDAALAKLGWFERELASLALPQRLPKGICHCDYDVSNLLFDGDRLVALLDFDDANYTYLSFDLVNLIDGWAWPYQQDFDPVAAGRIAQEYAAIRGLSTIEIRHIFDVHKLQILLDGVWYFGRGQVDDFYERRKIEHLNRMGRESYTQALFEASC